MEIHKWYWIFDDDDSGTIWQILQWMQFVSDVSGDQKKGLADVSN